eukprot:CAMPEP_0172617494 /NCGR_PEP_ID=MMETSP1068-20121228/70287_1 /TAXON_ID=35684 /ORGANISM="Pseudopedinella elastica, Strain CCMP716" /LENGTH=166 /DNA_ID=CAMNT_0013423263 /DNA_START=184 /DNA_END=681 /DNA_ORIENTATION=+
METAQAAGIIVASLCSLVNGDEIEDDAIIRFCESLEEEAAVCILSPHILALLMDSQHPKDAVQDFLQGITPFGGVPLNVRVYAIGHPPAHWTAIEINHDTKKMHDPGPLGEHRAQSRTKWCQVLGRWMQRMSRDNQSIYSFQYSQAENLPVKPANAPANLLDERSS